MKITELDDRGSDDSDDRELVSVKAKRAFVGERAWVLFYPTLLYNIFQNKIQAKFRWWDQVDQFLLLGVVPFSKDIPRLQKLRVCGVITLNKSYNTLVPLSLYQQKTLNQNIELKKKVSCHRIELQQVRDDHDHQLAQIHSLRGENANYKEMTGRATMEIYNILIKTNALEDTISSQTAQIRTLRYQPLASDEKLAVSCNLNI